jgi:protein-L-isoaspartate(D-aspartate) O-methyltransferase
MKGLDLGIGSGFMTVCISKLLGHDSITYAVEHISEILEFSKCNIFKNYDYLINNENIKFFCLDVREKVFQNEKFNIIHFGAAYDQFPESYKSILAIGGMAWIPVGKPNSQKIKIFKKFLNLKLKNMN